MVYRNTDSRCSSFHMTQCLRGTISPSDCFPKRGTIAPSHPQLPPTMPLSAQPSLFSKTRATLGQQAILGSNVCISNSLVVAGLPDLKIKLTFIPYSILNMWHDKTWLIAIRKTKKTCNDMIDWRVMYEPHLHTTCIETLPKGLGLNTNDIIDSSVMH